MLGRGEAAELNNLRYEGLLLLGHSSGFRLFITIVVVQGNMAKIGLQSTFLFLRLNIIGHTSWSEHSLGQLDVWPLRQSNDCTMLFGCLVLCHQLLIFVHQVVSDLGLSHLSIRFRMLRLSPHDSFLRVYEWMFVRSCLSLRAGHHQALFCQILANIGL